MIPSGLPFWRKHIAEAVEIEQALLDLRAVTATPPSMEVIREEIRASLNERPAEVVRRLVREACER